MIKKLDILVELGLLAKTYNNPIKCVALDAHDEIMKLRGAIMIILEENGHLADGENCTLWELKRAVGTTKP